MEYGLVGLMLARGHWYKSITMVVFLIPFLVSEFQPPQLNPYHIILACDNFLFLLWYPDFLTYDSFGRSSTEYKVLDDSESEF